LFSKPLALASSAAEAMPENALWPLPESTLSHGKLPQQPLMVSRLYNKEERILFPPDAFLAGFPEGIFAETPGQSASSGRADQQAHHCETPVYRLGKEVADRDFAAQTQDIL